MTSHSQLVNRLRELYNIIKIEREDYYDQLQVLKLFYDVDSINDNLTFKKIDIEPYLEDEQLIEKMHDFYKIIEIEKQNNYDQLQFFKSPIGIDGIKEFVYIIELNNNRKYVGVTNDFINRIKNHKNNTRESSQWIKENGFKRVLSIQEGNRKLEDIITFKTMMDDGWENVRGGSWASIDIKNPINDINCIKYDIDTYQNITQNNNLNMGNYIYHIDKNKIINSYKYVDKRKEFHNLTENRSLIKCNNIEYQYDLCNEIRACIKTMRHENNNIYENQDKIGYGIYNKFCTDRTLIYALVIAKTQSGKTGGMLATIKYFINDMFPQNIYIITGHSSNEWQNQTKERFPFRIKDRVYHRPQLKRKFLDDIKDKQNILIIIDEIHIACKLRQTLHDIFKTTKLF